MRPLILPTSISVSRHFFCVHVTDSLFYRLLFHSRSLHIKSSSLISQTSTLVHSSISVTTSVRDPERFRRSPLAAVQWEVGSLLAPDALSPLSWYDPKTGQLVQRLNFRIEAPPRTIFGKRTSRQEDGPGESRTSSLLASQDGPAIHLATPRPSSLSVGRFGD